MLDVDTDVQRTATYRSRERLITQEEVEIFAAVSGDHHPQHLDAAWAADSRFGTRVAHGMLVLSSVIPLVPSNPENVIALRAVDCVFKRPVAPGDRVKADVTVSEPSMLNETDGTVAVRIRATNQHDEVVLIANMKLLCTWPAGDYESVMTAQPATAGEWAEPLGEPIPGVLPL